MNYASVEKFILDMLKQKLSDKLYYHNVRHTEETIHAAEEFSKAEGLTGEEVTILKTAALFHDLGYLYLPAHNEPFGADFARKTLPEYGYTPAQIEKICSLIMATTLPQNPQNLEQQIICDADLQYLGTEESHEQAELLRKELSMHNNMSFSDRDWLDYQISFLKSHHYFTNSCRQSRNNAKAKYLKELIELRNKISEK
ncbi:MAG: HD domain-containing protein [Victivallaceae bacterium]